LVGEGVVAAEQVDQAAAIQKVDRDTPLGAILIEQRKIEARQIEQAVALQARKRMKLGEVLIAEGLVERSDIEAALAEQQRRRGRKLGDILIEMGTVNEGHILAALGVKFDLPLVDLEEYPVQPEALAQVPPHIQRRYGIVPIARDMRSLTIAISDPLATEPYDIVRALVDQEVREVLAPKGQIQALIERGGLAAPVVGEAGGATRLEATLRQALAQGAKAIHLLPQADGLAVTCHIEGGWQQLDTIALAGMGVAVKAILRLAAMDRLDPSRPHQGLLPLPDSNPSGEGEPRLLHVSTLPTPFGPSLMLEPLPPSIPLELAQLGLSPEAQSLVSDWLTQPHGLIVVAGPDGTGCDATVDALLARVAERSGHALGLTETLRLPPRGVTLWPVAPGTTGAEAVQTALRHRPDLLACALPIDEEGAAAALQAAERLPLLLRLQAHDAVGAVAQLRALGLPSPQLAATLRGILAQRQTERLCPDCRQGVAPHDEIRGLLRAGGRPDDGPLFRRGTGCPSCDGQEVSGQVSICELLEATPAVGRALAAQASGDDLQAVAVAGGMRPLAEQMLALARQGEVAAETLLPLGPESP